MGATRKPRSDAARTFCDHASFTAGAATCRVQSRTDAKARMSIGVSLAGDTGSFSFHLSREQARTLAVALDAAADASELVFAAADRAMQGTRA